MFKLLLMMFNPFFWFQLYDLIVNDVEDDSLDLTDPPRSLEEAKIQQDEYDVWKERQRKKGRIEE